MTKLQLFGLSFAAAIGAVCLFVCFFVVQLLIVSCSQVKNEPTPAVSPDLAELGQGLSFVMVLFEAGFAVLREFLRMFLWWV